MSFAGRLVHRLAIVTPAVIGDPEDKASLDERGNPVAAPDTVVLVRGLVQPRSATEVAALSQAGAEISDHVVFLLSRRIPDGSWIADADADGVLEGGRRFDITGVRSFEFGRSPHLEVDVQLIGATEGAAVGS